MSDTFQTKPPADRRREQHRCTCGARFEVGHYGDPLLTTVAVAVKCPACGKPHTISVPGGPRTTCSWSWLRGPEPETGGGG